MDSEELSEYVDSVLLANDKYMSVGEKRRIKKNIMNRYIGYDILSELLEDDEISDIMVNGKEDIFFEKHGVMHRYGEFFSDISKLENIIQKFASWHNRIVNESSPIADIRFEDGSRVNVVLPPIAINGPIVTIRKFPKYDYTLDKLVEIGTVTQEAVDVLKKIVSAKYNIFIFGGTGSGKTTFLNALSSYIPSHERVITIEDSAELKIQNVSNLVRLETRNAGFDGNNEVSMRELIRSSLRMRPDRIIVGEVRGNEVMDMLQAMSTGMDGSISTGHANSVKGLISRLETLILMSGDIPETAARRQIGNAIEILIHLGRMPDGSRKVLEISEIMYEDNDFVINCLFEYSYAEKDTGVLLRTANKLLRTDKIMRYGDGEEI